MTTSRRLRKRCVCCGVAFKLLIVAPVNFTGRKFVIASKFVYFSRLRFQYITNLSKHRANKRRILSRYADRSVGSIAMRYIPLLATSASCGRLSSVVGFITDDRGSRLTTENLNQWIFMPSLSEKMWAKFKWKFGGYPPTLAFLFENCFC